MDIKEIESKRDKDLIRISQIYVAAIEKAEIDYEQSPKTATEIYRKTKENARKDFEAAINQAEVLLAQVNRQAEILYSEAPVKAKEDYQVTKIEARDTFNREKAEIEKSFDEQAVYIVERTDIGR